MAEQIRLKIAELKQLLEVTQKRELEQKHSLENEKLDFLLKSELEQLESKYKELFFELENKSNELNSRLAEKHQQEMEDLYKYLDVKLPKNIKFSKAYLELKNQELNLAKQQKYKEAMIIKRKCDEMEMVDSTKFNVDKTNKIKSQSIKTAKQHINEKNNLKTKLDLEYEELSKRKEIDVKTLILKYKNRKNELDNQHKVEDKFCCNKSKLKAYTITNTIKGKQHIFFNSSGNNNFNYSTNNANENIDYEHGAEENPHSDNEHTDQIHQDNSKDNLAHTSNLQDNNDNDELNGSQ